MTDTLPNECSRPYNDTEYSTKLISLVNAKAFNVFFSRPNKSYSKSVQRGIVKIFEGQYWKVSMGNRNDDDELSENMDSSSCDSLESTFMSYVPKIAEERRFSH